MENTRKLNPDLGMIAWGAFFILWGITEMFPSMPEGTGAIGIGIILVGLNLARLWKRGPIGGFTTTFGILALCNWRALTCTCRSNSRSSPSCCSLWG